MQKTHELKILPYWFKALRDGRKKFEVRLNDRDYSPGDLVVFKEFTVENQQYTGERYWAQIGFVQELGPGIKECYCVFGIEHGSRIQKRKYNKIYRLNHNEKRNKDRKNNYSKSRPEKRKSNAWTEADINKLRLAHWHKTDRQLAKELARSVQAIQQKRYKLNLDAKKNLI